MEPLALVAVISAALGHVARLAKEARDAVESVGDMFDAARKLRVSALDLTRNELEERKRVALAQSISFHENEIHFTHCRIERGRDDIRLLLGTSAETSNIATEIALRRDELRLDEPLRNGDDVMDLRQLPHFTVTMLGPRGSGKSTFFTAMVGNLTSGVNGISITSLDAERDSELMSTLQAMYGDLRFPDGTMIMQTYPFCMYIGDRPIAVLDCVDYRGGDIEEAPGHPARDALYKRLRESDAILWAIDMAELRKIPQHGVDSNRARTKTAVYRMKSLCDMARLEKNRARAYAFVGMKSDVYGDLSAALAVMKQHLGEAVGICKVAGVSRGMFAVTSAIGMPLASGERDEYAKSINVQWPLLGTMALLWEAERARLDEVLERWRRQEATNSSQGLTGWVAQVFGFGTVDRERSAERIASLVLNIDQISANIQNIMRGRYGTPGVELLGRTTLIG